MGLGAGGEEGKGQCPAGDPSPRVAPRKTAARTQISSSSSRTPRMKLVTPMTRLCIWPSGLGWGLGCSVGAPGPSAGPEDRGQSRGPSSRLLQVPGPHTQSPSLPLGRAQNTRSPPEAPLPAPFLKDSWAWGSPTVGGDGVTVVLGVGCRPSTEPGDPRPPCPGGSTPAPVQGPPGAHTCHPELQRGGSR